MQAGAYQNGTWVVGVAKAGLEEGCELIGGTSIIAPTGEIVAQAQTSGDELIVARCDLDLVRSYKDWVFNSNGTASRSNIAALSNRRACASLTRRAACRA